jgi:hypothetical protein
MKSIAVKCYEMGDEVETKPLPANVTTPVRKLEKTLGNP